MDRLPFGHQLVGARFETACASLSRMRRDSDGRQYWVKAPKQDYPGDVTLRHVEAELRASAKAKRGPTAVTRIDDQKMCWLVYDEHPGEPLVITEPWSVEAFMRLAKPLTKALIAAHEAGLFFGLLEPSCVLWEPEHERVGLVGAIGMDDRIVVRGLVASPYAAPELHGHAEGDITLAADTYSLGCIFYQLLSGRVPVEASPSTSVLERRMQRIEPLSTEYLPEPLAELVMSMLSQSPVQRPPTTSLVLEGLTDLAAGTKRFDHALLFNLRRTVARNQELAALTARVEQALRDEGALIFVSGDPGVGKSALLKELKKRALIHDFAIAEGKFDQVRRGRPYSALLTAFRSAIELTLADVEAGFDRRRDRFAEADHLLLSVLRAELPELEHVAGRLPLAPMLGPSETDYRFKRAFRHLLECFCHPGQPLLLVLEDLQWADRATIELLKDWLSPGLPAGLALICCYRPDEVEAHVAEFLSLAGDATRVRLSPFELSGVTELCSEILPECEGLEHLSEVVYQRSHGNPLHAIEVLKNLVDAGDLVRSGGRWRLLLSQVRLAHVSDTVVELIVARIRAFSPVTRHTVMAAACIGQEFSAVLLGAALGREPVAIGAALHDAMAEGLLVTQPGEQDVFVFAHDRMQQAAFSLGDSSFKSEVRLKLGRHYLKGAATSRQCLFGAVEYLNLVRPALSEKERHDLAGLNWQAAMSARESIAYERTVSFVRVFLEDSQDVDPELRFSAALVLGECLFLDAKFAEAEGALELAWAAATDVERQVKVLRTSLQLYQHLQRYADAIRVGLRALRILGDPLPKRPRIPGVLLGLAGLMFRARGVSPAQLATRKDSSNERERLVLHLLVSLWGPTFWLDQKLNALVVIRLMTLTLRLGNAPSAAMAYVCFAVLNHVLLKRYEVALQYGRLAMAQLEVEGSAFVATRVRFLALTFFGSFERTPERNIAAYEEALKDCIASGELVGSHLLDGILTTLPVHGFSLATLHSRLPSYEKQARRLGAHSTLELVGVLRRWSSKLTDDAGSSLADLEVEFVSYRGVRDVLAMELAYLWHDDAEVLMLSARARKDVVVQSNPLHRALYCLFELMAECRLRAKLGRRGRAALSTLRRFARIYPPNFRSFQLLGEAEVLAVDGKDAAATEHYRQAIEEASNQGHELLGALATERLAAAYDVRGEKEQRDDCLRAAVFSYLRFGARAKAAQLKRRYPDLVSWSSRPEAASPADADLRLEAVMRAASAIAEETSSERLAPTLTRVVATAASAERAFLVQKVGEQWMVLTGWQVDVGDLLAEPVGLESCDLLAKGVVRYVCRTAAVVELADSTDQRFAEEPHLSRTRPRSVLCAPLARHGEVNAVLYLENSLYTEAFSPEQLRLVTLLGTQAAIALANSDNQRLQIEAVQSRVNPHFLYNALSVVAELIATSPEQAEAVVLKLSRLYRSMLNSSVDRMVTLEQELQLVRDYVELESARFGEKLGVDWQLDAALSPARVPSLLLQPLVENAVHHGIRRKLGHGTIKISSAREGGSLVLSVSDDGPGWYQSTGGNGFGLRSVEKRLTLLYGASAKLTITRGEGVTVRVQLPMG